MSDQYDNDPEYSSSSSSSEDEGSDQEFSGKIDVSKPYSAPKLSSGGASSKTDNARTDLAEKERIVDKYQKFVNNDKVKTAKTTNDRANRATVDNVLDPRTIRFIKKVFNNGLITEMNGTISTGKEANVYHAYNSNTGKEYLIKIYKTSILVFKDRERYVDGEYRFRHSKNQHNPRKMIKLWAEKEFRNLKRLYLNGIPSPEPLELKSHVLVMEYLTDGNGQPSPKLRDYNFKSLEQLTFYYHQMIIYMRQMFHVCRLVHADLSEYNSIIHQEKLYIFDVSQSVEPEHPMSLDFLRMDIKNVNDFFQREGVLVHPERLIFKFVIDDIENLELDKMARDDDVLLEKEYFRLLSELPVKDSQYEEDVEDEVFRSIHLVRSLNHLEEKDFESYAEGNISTLKQLSLDVANDGIVRDNGDDEEEDDDEEESSDDDESDDDDDDETATPAKEWKEREKTLKGKRYQDKEEKKERKKEAKDLAKEKRKTKMKKHLKKKLVNKGKK